MTKAIYYSKKMKKYYFNNVTAFGQYFAETVYGGENLIGGKIEIDKNGKQYILGNVVECVSKNTGRRYYKCTGYVEKQEGISWTVDEAITEQKSAE